MSVLLATNDCGNDWDAGLRDAYKPYLKGIALDNCASVEAASLVGKKCLINRALALLDNHTSDKRQRREFDMVLFMRPDLHFKSRGYEVVSAMVADRTRLTWPHKCEFNAWKKWLCTSVCSRALWPLVFEL